MSYKKYIVKFMCFQGVSIRQFKVAINVSDWLNAHTILVITKYMNLKGN